MLILIFNFYEGFEPNKGQVNSDVIFYTRYENSTVYITNKGFMFFMYNSNQIINYELIGSNIKKENIIYEDELPGYANYYLPSSPYGILFVKSYRKVIIKDVYQNIDLIFRYDEYNRLHYEFLAYPNSDISQIKIKLNNSFEISDNKIKFSLSKDYMEDGNLIAYTDKGDIIPVKYKVNENIISFELNKLSNDAILIDPQILVWSTYYGGEGLDVLSGIITDNNGNVYIVGSTKSINFPLYNPQDGSYFDGICGIDGSCNYRDIVILKFDNNGQRLWATYYGGNNDDYASSITLDNNNNVIIVGSSKSPDFPVYNPGYGYFDGICGTDGYCNLNTDAIILKFNSAGIREWATYYGGSNEDMAISVVSYNNEIFVSGSTRSNDLNLYNSDSSAYFQGLCRGCPTENDIFILKFSSTNNLLWATYYGGNSTEYVQSSSIDNMGNLFLVGYTNSLNFPTYNPGNNSYYQGDCINCECYVDGFILKFNNSGKLLWGTYYGGNGADYFFSITTDLYNNIFISGHTSSNDFPTYNPGNGAYFSGSCNGNCANNDAVILKFDNNGVREWATYFGGINFDNGYYIKSDYNGDVILAGHTNSFLYFPIYNPNDNSYFDNTCDKCPDSNDIFISKFSNSGVLKWSTFFGGGGNELVPEIAIDNNNNIFIAGITYSNNLPLYNLIGGYLQNNYGGNGDGLILKFSSSFLISISENNKVVYIKDKIYLNVKFSENPMKIQIYDIGGRVVLNKFYKTTYPTYINLNELKDGVYILKVLSNNEQILNLKFIKRR